MVKALEKISVELQKLSKEKQSELTDSWMDEIQWQMQYENSQSELGNLVNEALEEYRTGKTEEL